MKFTLSSLSFTRPTNVFTRSSRRARLVASLALFAIALGTLAGSASSASLRARLLGVLMGDAVKNSRSAIVKHSANNSAAALTAAPVSDVQMNLARRGHTATLLADGKVLIAGGENSSGVLNQCEIYDSATGNFAATGNLNAARADHSATLLADGRVLIAGGRDSAGAVNTTEIFDPATGVFTSGPNLSVARAGHSATLFADGRILIAGGDGGGNAEVLDVLVGTSSVVGANMNDARSMHSAAQLQDGRVLIVGGRDAGGNELSSGEIFDPASSSFTGVGGMEVARVRPLLRVLFDGKVQIIGGTDGSMETYDPAAGIFGGYAQVPPDGDLHSDLINEIMSAPTRAALLIGGQTVTELGNSALAAGGADANGDATNASTIYASSGASVSSDKIDYLPGTQVIITGRGFQPNESVVLTFHEYPHVDTAELHTFTVQADADGNFTFDQYSPEAADVGITYILGAKGETSGRTAQTTFHDSVSVTAATGGNNISADKAANSTGPVGGTFTSIGNIVLSEGLNGDFPVQSNTTLILTAPGGWQFNPGVGSTSTTKSGAGANELIDNSITVTATTITVNISVTATAQINTLTISGIQVKATDGANVPGSGNILRTVGNPGTATITGVTNGSTNFGSLSQIAGATNKLVVTLPGQTFTDANTVAASGNSGAVTAQTAGIAFNISNIRATDQFFNVITTYSGAKTISYTGPGTNSGFAAPSYTTAVNFVSGVSTTALATTLRKAETTTITASDGTTTGPASSSLTVNAGALASFSVTNTSDGNIGTQTAGTAFDIKVRAVDAGGNVVTSFDANGNKVSITPSSGTLSAGGGNTDSFINGVLALWSVTFSTSGTYPGSFSLTATGLGGNSGITGTSNTFTVNAPPCTTPSVTTQPTGQSITYGVSTSLTAAASGTPAPTIQWQVSSGGPFTNLSNTAPYSGVTTGTLTITTPTVSLNGNQYRAVFTNTCATVNSNSVSLTVSPKALTETGLSASSKIYDGTTAATLTGTPALLASEALGTGTTFDGKPYTGDAVSITGTPVGTLASKDVANGISVTVSGTSLIGAQAGNYTLTQQTGVTADITAKALTYSGLSVPASKIYDGTTSAVVSGSAALQSTEAAGAGNAADGKPYNVDSVSVTGTPTGTYNSKDVATATTVTFGGISLTGAGSGNYTLTASTQPATITAKALTYTGLTAPASKVYDATTSASVSGSAALQSAEPAGAGATSDGKPYTVDSVSVTGTGSGSYNSKDVASATTVTFSGISLTGTGNGNYTLTASTQAATISAKALIVSGLSASDKIYDATTAATITGTASLQTAEAPGSGTISDGKPYTGDLVTISGTPTGTFASANVGNGISVSVSGTSLSGAQAGNYTVTQQTGLSADITPKALTVTGLTANNKPYDSTTTATLSGTAALLSSEAAGSGTTSDNKPYTVDTVSVTGTPSGTFASANVADGINVSVSGLSLIGGSAGNYSLTALNLSANITPATVTASIIGNPTKTYDGNTNATLTAANFSLSGLAGSESFTVTKTSGSYNSADVATATTVTTSLIAGDFTPGSGTLASNYALPTSASGAGHINKADAAVVVSPYNVTYDGSPHTATITSISGVNGETGATVGTVDVSNTMHTNAGTYASDYWFFTGAANYNNIGNTTISDEIARATAVVVVTPYSVTYNGLSHTATVTSITGVNGETGATVGTIDVSNTTHTNAGTYSSDYWFFTGTANYNNIGNTTISDEIEKATADCSSIVGYTGTYDAAAHGASGVCKGVSAETLAGLNLGATYTNVPGGTAHWVFTDVTGNYHDNAGDVAITISKATATISVTPYSVTYDGAAHTATGSATGVAAADLSASLNLSGTTHTNAGTYNGDAWSFAGGTNYNDANGTVDDHISKAASVTTVTCGAGPFTYSGSAIEPCSVTVTGAGGLNLSPAPVYANNVAAGVNTASASYTFTGDDNRNGSNDSKNFSIDKAASTTTIDCSPGSFTYTGSAITPCTATVTRVGDANTTTTVVYANNINVGTATADASYGGDANHTGSNATQVTFSITQASSATSIDCSPGSFTYTGSAITPCTATVTRVGDPNTSTTVVYGNNTNVGTATADASYGGDLNHTGSTAVQATFMITPAASATTIDCSPGSFTYTGSAITPCTATVTRVGDANTTTSVVYANNTNVGTATADAAYGGDANHTGSNATQVTFSITQASSATSIDCSPGSFTYTGSAITPCTATVTRVGDPNTSTTVVYGNNTNVGTATADASYGGDANHTGSNATQVTFSITQASSATSIDCSPGSFTYTGSAIMPCTATVTRVGDANTSTTIVYTNNINVGTATADAAYGGDANHTSSNATQVTFSITKRTLTASIIGNPTKTYDETTNATLNSANYSISNLVAGQSVTVTRTTGTYNSKDVLAANTVSTPLASGDFTAGPGTNLANYILPTSASGAGHITAKGLVITADNKSFPFGGTLPTLTATYDAFATGEGAGNLTGTITFTIQNVANTAVPYNASTPSGTYTIVPSGVSSTNYNISFVNGTLTIGGWTITGFYQPVDMSTPSTLILNSVKGGSTVPLKFNIYAGTVENKSVSAVQSFQVATFNCAIAQTSLITDLDFTTTGGTSLRYDTTAGQFIQNWQTPKPAGVCYQVRMTALDGSHIDAFFKTK